MELFALTCTTCNSKLKVRDKALIGQIVACPKCHGMVLIQPPAGWSSDSSIAPVATVAQAMTASAQGAPKPASLGNFEDAATLLEQSGAVHAPPVQAPVVAPVAAVAALPEIVPLLESVTKPLWQQWWFIGGTAVTCVTILAGGLIYAVSGNRQPKEVAVVPPVVAEKVVDDTTTKTVDDKTEKPAPQPMMPPTETPSTTDTTPPEKPTETTPPRTTDDTTPPDIAPKPMDDETPKALDTFNIDGTLKEFGSLIEERPFGSQAPVEKDPTPDPAAEALLPTEDKVKLPRPAPRKTDVMKRLSEPLEGIQMDSVPLADFLQMMTDLTTVPITLDPLTLPAIKVSPESKVSVRLQGTKASDALLEALRPHQLTLVVDQTQATVVPLAVSKGELREIKHDLSDLAAIEGAAKTLAEIVHAAVLPQSWDDAGGKGSLRVEGTNLFVSQTPEVQYSLILFCEKLRLARKLPTRSKYPAEVLTLTPRAIAADSLLTKQVTMNFVPPTRLGHVADFVKKSHQVRVLIDWRALGEAGWTPEAEIKVGIASQPLASFFDRLSQRMEIAWRVVDANTVELTSLVELDRRADLEVYPLVADDGPALVDKLQQHLGEAQFGPGSPCVLRYDATGKCLIARLPQPLQRKLIAFLAQP